MATRRFAPPVVIKPRFSATLTDTEFAHQPLPLVWSGIRFARDGNAR